MSRRIVPLHMTMWSAKEEGLTSENDKVLDVTGKIARACEGRGICVYDRGGDGDWLFDFFVEGGWTSSCGSPASAISCTGTGSARPRSSPGRAR